MDLEVYCTKIYVDFGCNDNRSGNIRYFVQRHLRRSRSFHNYIPRSTQISTQAANFVASIVHPSEKFPSNPKVYYILTALMRNRPSDFAESSSRILLRKFRRLHARGIFFLGNSFSGISVISDTEDSSAQVSKIVRKTFARVPFLYSIRSLSATAASWYVPPQGSRDTQPLEGNSPLDSRIPTFWNVTRTLRGPGIVSKIVELFAIVLHV